MEKERESIDYFFLQGAGRVYSVWEVVENGYGWSFIILVSSAPNCCKYAKIFEKKG